MKKRGYFFTLDAFIAVGIITAGLFLIFVSSSHRPFQEQAVFFADDLMNGLARQTLRDTNEPYIQQLRRDGNISNLDITLFEQLGDFYVRRSFDQAAKLAEAVTKDRVPPQYGYAIRINGTELYAAGVLLNTTPLLVRSKTIISGISNSTEFWGPLEAEVRVWLQ